MSKIGKVALFVLLLAYIISPLDAVPGPIDDAVVTIIGIAAMKRIGANDD